MKKLCIQVCEKAQLTVEVTPEMEIDFLSAGIWRNIQRSLKIVTPAAGTARILLVRHLPVRLWPNGAAGKGESYGTINA